MGIVKLLDLFCGQGGAARGYASQFTDILGIDHKWMKKYPYRFIMDDATTFPLAGFDLIHASPPCLDHSVTRHMFNEPDGSGWMLEHTLNRCQEAGVHYCIENVMTADIPDRPADFMLCGAALAPWAELGGERWFMQRHRKFWCSFPVNAPECQCERARGLGYVNAPIVHGKDRPRARAAIMRQMMGVDWMNLKEMNSAIPASFTVFIAREFQRAR